jgi:PPOX class probable F420-dependent enzyme
MPRLNKAARDLVGSGALAHLVTLNADGTPQVAIVWMGVDGEELVSGHLMATQQKLRNVRRDPRVVISFEAGTANPIGMRDYLVVHGTARVTEGGAPELLNRLAQTYVGPGTTFPPMPDPPPGFVVRVAIDRIGGSGKWAEKD